MREVRREFGRHALGLLSRGRIHDARPARLVRQQFARQIASRWDGAASTTSIAMLARRKPWMNRAGRTSPNCSAMSSCTIGVAVAVSAMTGAGRSRRQVLAEHAVVRPEIVPPLGNAVRLVDGDQRRLALRQHLGEAGHAQPLGRDEQELQLPSR